MSEALFTRVSISAARASEPCFRPAYAGFDFTRQVQSESDDDGDRYAEGYEAGTRAATLRFDKEREGLTALIAAAEALAPEPSEELAALIGETVERLVAQIVGTTAIDRDWLHERAARAAALIGECDQARTMWLHPADLALLDGAALPLKTMADPQAERGSIRIDCSAGWIESARSLHLDALRAELGMNGERL